MSDMKYVQDQALYTSNAHEGSGNFTLASTDQNEGPYSNQRDSKGRVRKAPKERMSSRQLINDLVVYSNESVNQFVTGPAQSVS